MIKRTVKEIKARIKQESGVADKTKEQLLTLLSTLESEIDALSKTHFEHAESITGFIERSTHEATRKKKQPELLKISLAGLEESVKGFEASHPSLVAKINDICTVLANMGV
jgi:hypothetical protein